ncbi:hypothetical protein EUX98_g1663 [Antrodiella citrinella]|uniref:Serine/threonine-protein kinase Tel1 n=1 Tax=Antrodiella citrinella TaxID=2447956 RepID=A0A4V3XJC1_9APHY|nr:hypothetical protein EUX98_g1663 [Antrodiella citrinella]
MSHQDRTLNTLCKQLESDKIKERQEAVSTLREAFASDKAVSSMDTTAWNRVFSSLQEAFTKELLASTKKGALPTASTGPGATALKRLGEVASTIRWLTEKSVHSFNTKVAAPLLEHLIKSLKYRSRLLDPVAVHYIKAIKTIISCTRHLRHLESKDTELWLELLETGFNVILGDSLSRVLDEMEDGGEGSQDEAMLGTLGTEMDSGSAEEEDGGTPRPTNPRKRRLPERRLASRSAPPAKSRKVSDLRSVSSEQVAFASVLATLLKSENAPLLSPLLSSDGPSLPAAILHRLSRFLSQYPGESTLHHDYLQCLSGTLSHVALNHRKDVTLFARRTWSGLIGIWGTRTQSLKEELVVVLTILFPYLTTELGFEKSTGATYEDAVNKLWRVLMSEAEKRGVDGLSLDCIRLQVITTDEATKHGAFISKSFRHGWHFDSGQALSWAILSLQTECAEKLFMLSESIDSTINDSGKRVKRENPITSLLSSISSSASSGVRAYRLQGLLFFIDRYWEILHDDLRKVVVNTLQHFLSLDDALVQSWTFLCLAAIGNAESSAKATSVTSSQQSVLEDSTTWNNIWTHAMRRITVPAVCRAACHASYTLLYHSRLLLTPQQVLVEIETLAKDLDVQGPSFPYDSACSFLVLCMRVASHDVRLYRMQLEEKVLTWLTDVWRPGAFSKARMSLHTVEDVLSVLGSICCVANSISVLCPMKLPDCPIVAALVEEDRYTVIRDYLLHARLPDTNSLPTHRNHNSLSPRILPSASSVEDIGSSFENRELVQPRGRERRISAFLQKTLEDLFQHWDVSHSVRPSAEKTRMSLDFAVISLLFEATLVTNGTRPNRRVQQAAYKLLSLVMPRVTDSLWVASETALIVAVLEPLVLAEAPTTRMNQWHTLLPAGVGSGVPREELQAADLCSSESTHAVLARRALQKAVFQNPDAQDMVIKITDILHSLLQRMLAASTPHGQGHHIDASDGDNFAAMDTARVAATGFVRTHLLGMEAHQQIISVCVTCIAVFPILESTSGEPTRDRKLLKLIETFELEDWLMVGPAFIENVRLKTLHLSTGDLTTVLENIGNVLKHRSANDSPGQFLVIALLQATMHIWIDSKALLGYIGPLCSWLCTLFTKSALRSWTCRDRFVQFLGSYIEVDPAQAAWEGMGDEPPELKPSDMLPIVGEDLDVRVRFRAAVANASLVRNAHSLGSQPMDVYTGIKAHTSVDVDESVANLLVRALQLILDIFRFEHILTRLLCLGNVMIVSSAVRRGPLWHLLELCLHSHVYVRHVETILSGVARRLNMSSSTLFMAYASQIAYSLKNTDRDFLQLPSHLLGYRDKRECAEATFSAFTPTNVLMGSDRGDQTRGRNLFKLHCQATKKTLAEGIAQCFAEIVGYQVVSFVDSHDALEPLTEKLIVITKDVRDQFLEMLRQHADGIVTAILRTLGDQDFSEEGPIAAALRDQASADSSNHFRALTRYRHLHVFEVHEPNLPAFPATAILRSLNWLTLQVPSVNQHATTYHILHQLFADIGKSPLVNEQIRLLSAVSLWASLHHHDFQDATILRTFVNGAANILPQLDLARTAQSLLEWGFSIYLRSRTEEPRLASILIHVSCTAYDYSVSRSADVATMGRDMLRWAEEQARRLWKSRALIQQVTQALSVWPAELSTDVQSRMPVISAGDVSAVLNDSRISFNKFRLVQRLRDLATQASDVNAADFWTLKSCIPAKSLMSSSDVEAFCEYIVSHKGFGGGLELAHSSMHSVRTRHVKGIRKGDKGAHPANGEAHSAQQAIVVSLLAILEEPSISQVQLSYATLRALMSVLPMDRTAWPGEYYSELLFLKDYCRGFSSRPQPDLRDLVTNGAWVEIASDFPNWTARVAPILSDFLATHEPFYTPLFSILQAHPGFAEQVFPVLVHTALQMERSGQGPQTGTRIRATISTYFERLLRADTTSASCRRTIVDTILHLRNFVPASSKDPMRSDALSYDKWLDVDFVLLSKNAIVCGAYTTAVLFLELAAEYNGLSGTTPETEQIMYDIYNHIEEPDGFYGIDTHDLQNFLMQRFHHEKQWDKAFQFHGANLETRSSGSVDAEGVLQSLHAFGFDHLAMSTLHDANAGATLDTSGMTYQLGWRTEKWDLPERTGDGDIGSSLYVALRAVYRERDSQVVSNTLRRALASEMVQLSHLGSESVTDIRQILQNLMCLHQVTQWNATTSQPDWLKLDLCKMIAIDDAFEFHDLEAIVAVRVSLLRSALQKEQREQIGDMLSPLSQTLRKAQTACLLRLSQAARDANQTQIAMNSIVRAQQLSTENTFDVSEEFSEVIWLMKEPKLAVQYLGQLLGYRLGSSPPSKAVESMRTASTLAKLGRWSSEASLEKPADIASKYFGPAAEFATSHSDQSQATERAAIYHHYAMFSERQYHGITKSSDALKLQFLQERKNHEIQRRREELSKMNKRTQTELDLYKAAHADIVKAGKTLDEDKRQFQEHIDTRDASLTNAIEMYSRSLEVSDDFDDDSAIRLCSLWFANFEYRSGNFQQGVADALHRVPSRKFVFLAHQLTARILDKASSSNRIDQKNLQQLVIRMCREHPFHSLYQVWCLLSERESLPSSSSSSSSRRKSRMEPEAPASQILRANAAVSIFDKLRGDGDFSKCVRDVEEICRASLEWASYPIKDSPKYKENKPVHKVPEQLGILKMHNLKVPVITAPTPVDPTLLYDRCIWIESYEKEFSLAGGVNLPKISVCNGSDGVKYKQLFKGEGKDDLRQDAVMEQVFELVNIILRRDRDTRKRNLSVRSYKVVPLSSQAGLLEFVVNTSPLKSFLDKAHPKYYPKDWSGRKIGDELRAFEKANRTHPDVLAMVQEKYLGYIEHFHPVMRHYFTDRHKSPMYWFQMRLNYQRSVATTSIVGHILGLGDRHTSNILMDNSTGEVVHIDLGIAFDQGKMLQIPERVPFRLTRDMVDGLGTSGTQGVFQRCAEETLRVLRAGSGVILTVLEVFKYDPLHSWTASEIKVMRVQGTGETVQPLTGHLTEEAVRYAFGIDMRSTLADEHADRALNAVSRKLDKSMTVEYTVNELIAEATDIRNVSNMFAGWGPHY